MNGYLVLVRCGLDDLPVQLFGHEEEALRLAKQLTPDSDEVAWIKKVLDLDTSVFHAVTVLEFRLGKPTAVVFTRDLDDEEVPA